MPKTLTPDVPSCWECEAPTDDPIEAVLTVSDHHVIRVRLCAACCCDQYRSLVADTADSRLLTTR